MPTQGLNISGLGMGNFNSRNVKRKNINGIHQQYRQGGCGCFVDTDKFYLVLQFGKDISLQQFKSSDTIKELKLRFIQQFNLKHEIFNDKMYTSQLSTVYDKCALSLNYSDQELLQSIYLVICRPHVPITLIFHSNIIEENLQINRMKWQKMHDSMQVLLVNTNKNILNSIASHIISFIIGTKESNLPLPLINNKKEKSSQKYIYNGYVDQETLCNAAKCLVISNTQIINGINNQCLEYDNKKWIKFVKEIKQRRLEYNNNSVCQQCYCHEYSDGSGNMPIKVIIHQSNNNYKTITLSVDCIATIYQIKQLIASKQDISLQSIQQRTLIFAGNSLEDHKSLREYSTIQRESTLRLI